MKNTTLILNCHTNSTRDLSYRQDPIINEDELIYSNRMSEGDYMEKLKDLKTARIRPRNFIKKINDRTRHRYGEKSTRRSTDEEFRDAPANTNFTKYYYMEKNQLLPHVDQYKSMKTSDGEKIKVPRETVLSDYLHPKNLTKKSLKEFQKYRILSDYEGACRDVYWYWKEQEKEGGHCARNMMNDMSNRFSLAIRKTKKSSSSGKFKETLGTEEGNNLKTTSDNEEIKGKNHSIIDDSTSSLPSLPPYFSPPTGQVVSKLSKSVYTRDNVDIMMHSGLSHLGGHVLDLKFSENEQSEWSKQLKPNSLNRSDFIDHHIRTEDAKNEFYKHHLSSTSVTRDAICNFNIRK